MASARPVKKGENALDGLSGSRPECRQADTPDTHTINNLAATVSPCSQDSPPPQSRTNIVLDPPGEILRAVVDPRIEGGAAA